MCRTIVIHIQTVALPGTVRGVSRKTDKDTFDIFINADQTEDQKTASFLHECLHIYHNDFDTQNSADRIEKTRHAELRRLVQLLSENRTE